MCKDCYELEDGQYAIEFLDEDYSVLKKREGNNKTGVRILTLEL